MAVLFIFLIIGAICWLFDELIFVNQSGKGQQFIFHLDNLIFGHFGTT